MFEDENLIAEQVVSLHQNHQLTVRISQHAVEEFWRVDVTNPAIARGQASATVGNGDGFLMNLIEEAVGGQQLAWQHLAQWGHDSLSRPGGGRIPA